jgi:hypothetical protein
VVPGNSSRSTGAFNTGHVEEIRYAEGKSPARQPAAKKTKKTTGRRSNTVVPPQPSPGGSLHDVMLITWRLRAGTRTPMGTTVPQIPPVLGHIPYKRKEEKTLLTKIRRYATMASARSNRSGDARTWDLQETWHGHARSRRPSQGCIRKWVLYLYVFVVARLWARSPRRRC